MPRNKSKYRSTYKSETGHAVTKYFDDLGRAVSHAKPLYSRDSGTISVLNRSTNRFKKKKKYNW